LFAYNVSHPDFRAKLRNEAITKTKLSREIADAISSTVSGWIRDYDALRTRCEDYNADLGTAACAVLNDAYRLNIPLQQNELQRMRLPIIAREERMAKAHERKRQAELDATIPRGRKPGRKKRGSSERELATQPPEKKPKGEKKSSRFYSPRYPNGHVKYRVG
jgi:uncharacterized protein (DUF2336 family)